MKNKEQKIKRLLALGLSQREVSKQLNVTRYMVRKFAGEVPNPSFFTNKIDSDAAAGDDVEPMNAAELVKENREQITRTKALIEAARGEGQIAIALRGESTLQRLLDAERKLADRLISLDKLAQDAADRQTAAVMGVFANVLQQHPDALADVRRAFNSLGGDDV